MDHHVFISYSRRDATLARRIAQDLRADGLSVWMDDEGLEPGTPEWGAAIGDAIENAGCMVAVLSPDAAESPWVSRELNHADKFRIRVFPILIRGDERNAVPFVLATTQWIDGRGHDGERVEPKAFDQLLTAVCKHVKFESHSQREKRLEQEEMQRLVAEKERQLRAEQAEQERLRRDVEARREAERRVRREQTARKRRKIGLALAGVAAVGVVLVIGVAIIANSVLGADDPPRTPAEPTPEETPAEPTPESTTNASLSEIDLGNLGIAGQQGTPTSSGENSSGGDPVILEVGCEQFDVVPPAVRTGQDIVFVLNWFATEDYWLGDYELASRFRLLVDGQEAAVQPLFSDYYSTGQYPFARGVTVYFPYGPLPAGQHQVELITSWDRVITDGVNNYGSADWDPATDAHNSCTFAVQ